eukprot:gene12446-26186_t
MSLIHGYLLILFAAFLCYLSLATIAKVHSNNVEFLLFRQSNSISVIFAFGTSVTILFSVLARYFLDTLMERSKWAIESSKKYDVMNNSFPKMWTLRSNIGLVISYSLSQLFICLKGLATSDSGILFVLILQIILEAIFCVIFLRCFSNYLRFYMLSCDIVEGEDTVWYISNIKFRKDITMKSTVARYLSHQLRTPMNTVTLALQCLKSHLKNVYHGQNDTLELLHDAMISTVGVTAILENIVTYESLSANTLKIYLRAIFPPDFLDNAIRPYIDQAENKNIELNIESKNEIIHTLVSNAIKYTKKKGNVHVLIEYSTISDNLRYNDIINGISMNASGLLKIRVKDSGKGIKK